MARPGRYTPEVARRILDKESATAGRARGGGDRYAVSTAREGLGHEMIAMALSFAYGFASRIAGSGSAMAGLVGRTRERILHQMRGAQHDRRLPRPRPARYASVRDWVHPHRYVFAARLT